jgi:phosphonopyruvate decarboxylase
MIDPSTFHQHLSGHGIDFFTGVPDSLFKSLLLYWQDHIHASHHLIATNEGQAVALATGYHLATGKLPLVYMQNSGLGNAVNPLTSLADKEVYAIPLLLLIGWRGRPGTKDEPQHIKMGRITEQLLQVLEIPFYILSDNEAQNKTLIDEAIAMTLEQQQPVALLAPENIFGEYKSPVPAAAWPLSREEVLKQLVQHAAGNEMIVCTTGKTGREFYELNGRSEDYMLPRHFLCVGAMGLASQVALGISLQQDRRVIMIDGDGALFMHLGSLASIGQWGSDSYMHIVINNGCHESVGGQPTLGFAVDLCAMASACGYQKVVRIDTDAALTAWLQSDFHEQQKQFVEIRVNAESRSNLSRPVELPVERKEALMPLLKKKV